MLEKFGDILAALTAVGLGLVVVASLLGSGSLWLLGAAVFMIAFPLMLVVGALLLGRRVLFAAGRATGALPPEPMPEPVPAPGSTGWLFALEDTAHEVWVTTGEPPKFLLDGAWLEPTLMRVRRDRQPCRTFVVAGHPATLEPEIDRSGMARGALLLVAIAVPLALAGGSGPLSGGGLPIRWRLQVDGVERPDRERVVAGAARALGHPRVLAPPDSGPVVMDHDGAVAAGRRLRSRPPGRH
jgi:hypothetical protein